MDIDKIYELLDIEDITEFKYFENLAALLEADIDIDFDEIYYIVEKLDLDMLKDLFKDYFEDIISGVPESLEDVYILLDNIKTAFIGLCKNNDDENQLVLLSEEILKFRNWYNFDTDVICKDNATGETLIYRVKDALMLYRSEKFGGKTYSYDFDECLNYELSEYVITFENEDENENYDYTKGREEEALLESSFLYDDEFSDEY